MMKKSQLFQPASVEVVRFIGVLSNGLLLLIENLHLVADEVLYLLLQDPVHHLRGLVWPLGLFQTYRALTYHAGVVSSDLRSYLGQ